MGFIPGLGVCQLSKSHRLICQFDILETNFVSAFYSYADLLNYVRLKKNKTFICKPDSGCQGKGIFLTKNPLKDIKSGDNYVAQVYISKVRYKILFGNVRLNPVRQSDFLYV
jgi:hypothetical protein